MTYNEFGLLIIALRPGCFLS